MPSTESGVLRRPKVRSREEAIPMRRVRFSDGIDHGPAVDICSPALYFSFTPGPDCAVLL